MKGMKNRQRIRMFLQHRIDHVVGPTFQRHNGEQRVERGAERAEQARIVLAVEITAITALT